MKYQSAMGYYSTKQSLGLCGVWLEDNNTSVIKELHCSTKNNNFFLVIYIEGGKHYIRPITVPDAMNFCEQYKKLIKWFPGGKDEYSKIINSYIQSC